MTFCKVNHMNIVSHTSSVQSIIVITEYTQFFQLAYSHLCNIWHQIIWNAVWILADSSALMCSDWVKVAKKHYIPLRICFLNVGENLLQHGLGPTVRIGALSLRTVFCNRNLCRITINRCRRRENNVLYIMLSHHIHQSQSTSNIIFIIFPWFCNRFANGF